MPRTLEYQSYSAPTIPHIEDTFTFPEELEESKKIKYALEVVTNKYLFYLQAAASAYKYPGMPNILEGVYDKLTHTNDVIKAAIETFEPGNSATLEDVVLAAIYHDMYRSFQGFYFFDYRDGVTGYKHGEEAATFMREKIPAEFISEQVIVAVNSHSKFTPDNQEYLTLVIRDIDKIAIIRRITQIQDRLERTRDSVLESGLSEDIKATFRRQTDIQPSVLNPEIIPH